MKHTFDFGAYDERITIGINEEDRGKVKEWQNRLDAMNFEQQKMVIAYLDNESEDLEEALSLVENEAIWDTGCKTMADIAESQVREAWWGHLDEFLMAYIDFKALGNDLYTEGNYIIANDTIYEYE